MDEELRAIRAEESIADEVYDTLSESDDALDASDAFVYAMLDIA